ncbi:MAG: DNA primase [Lachnospiraceae bacterium]|nr:DNA primase [Lachnospiraceae bacterium]MDY5742171.1 DNA primase [Lachnospiraceae bacterium]
MRFSDDIIEEIRSRSSIVDVIGRYVHLEKKGQNYFGCCPFHSEKTASFSVTPKKDMFYCFGCGKGGNIFTFLMEYENLSFVEALEYLAKETGVELPKEAVSAEQQAAQQHRDRLFEMQKQAAGYFYYNLKSRSGERARAYFDRRGLSEQTIHSFGLGFANNYADDLYQFLKQKGFNDQELADGGLVSLKNGSQPKDKFWNRVMFPIMDVRGRVIGFGGRVMGDGEPKYLNSPETEIFIKNRNLYGIHKAKQTKDGSLLLCEGYMDVIAMHQAGFTNAVASLGTALTQGHASLMKKYAKAVYLLYDSDGAGVKAALRAIPILRDAGLLVRVVDMRPYKDPDELIKAIGADGLRERLQASLSSFYYETDHLQAEYRMDEPESRTAFIKALMEKVLQLEDELERQQYTEAVCKRYGIEQSSFVRLLKQKAAAGVTVPQTANLVRLSREQRIEAGLKKSQRLLLTWLVEQPKIYDFVKQYVSPDDFTYPLYHQVAIRLYEQLDSDCLRPAAILDHYQQSELAAEVAEIFHTSVALGAEGDKDRALRETVVKIKENSLDVKQQAGLSLPELQQMILQKKQLEELKKW